MDSVSEVPVIDPVPSYWLGTGQNNPPVPFLRPGNHA